MRPIYRAWFKNKMWFVETLFMGKVNLGARFSNITIDGKYEWEYTNSGDFELMEALGLCDKNKRRIYEGDIVKYRYMGVEVYDLILRDHTNTGFRPFIGEHRDETPVQSTFVEIVGNKLENPELLEKTQYKLV